MKVPQTFVTSHENIERKIKDLMEDHSKEEDCIKKLDRLKTGKSKERRKEFLETFVEHVSYFIEKVRKKMEKTGVNMIYLDDPKDYKTRNYGYRTRFEINLDGHLLFVNYISGNGYQSDLDEEYYSNYWSVYQYFDTYPDKENVYSFYGKDTIASQFKKGKELYEGMKLFLKGNKTL